MINSIYVFGFQMSPIIYLAALLLVSCTLGDNSTAPAAGDACGPWSAALEDWATADRGTLTRHGMIDNSQLSGSNNLE